MKAGQALNWRDSQMRERVHPALIVFVACEVLVAAMLVYFAAVPA